MTDLWIDITRTDRCYIIAEIGVNHNGSVEMACQLIDVAADAGADAVKFQSFFAEELVTANAEQSDYQVKNLGVKTSQFEMLSKLELTAGDYAQLKTYCRAKGIAFLSTPFSERAVDMLQDIGVDGFKVSSGDLTHIPLLKYIASKGKPVILSSGMADLADVEEALQVFVGAYAPKVAVLHCVSDYPTAPADCNLRAMNTLREAFKIPVGWSDHTNGFSVSLASIAMGAQILEKHYTLDRSLPGPDHISSLEPAELFSLIEQARQIEQALGTGIKKPTASEIETMKVGRRSLTALTGIKAGDLIEPHHVAVRRPGTGIAPRHYHDVIGMRAGRDFIAGDCFHWNDLTAPLNRT